MHGPGWSLSKNSSSNQKSCGLSRSFPKNSFPNKKKSPHPAQHHDSNRAFCWLIAASFFKRKKTDAKFFFKQKIVNRSAMFVADAIAAIQRTTAAQTMSQPKEAAPTKPQCLTPQKKAATQRIDVVHPKKNVAVQTMGPQRNHNVSWQKKNRDNEGLMLRAWQHKTMSCGPKRLRQRITNVSRPQKKDATTKDRCRVPPRRTAAKQNNVAWPKRPCRQNTNVPRGHDDKAGMPQPSKHRRGNESPTRAASKSLQRQSRNAVGCGNKSPMSCNHKKRCDDKGSMLRASKKDRSNTKQCCTAQKAVLRKHQRRARPRQ